jgi:hypothetical protein
MPSKSKDDVSAPSGLLCGAKSAHIKVLVICSVQNTDKQTVTHSTTNTISPTKTDTTSIQVVLAVILLYFNLQNVLLQ